LGGWAAIPAELEFDTPLSPAQRDALDEWTLVQAREEIVALGHGNTPARLLMVPEVGQIGFWTGTMRGPADSLASLSGVTLQQDRGSRASPHYTPPGYDPLVPGVPSLAELTSAALNALDDDPDGFYLMVEGGAIDWAMHGNQVGRMIEEMEDFRGAIDAVLAWVESHGGWDETIVVITADHDHLLWGPDANTVPFDPVRDGGPGNLPGYRWLADSHSAALVPVFARGVGSGALESLAGKRDPRRGPYLDQADIFAVLRGLL
ncbi:alkaline phosphatase, partial [bacterium]|nr:alkaline phosphatase [bacterium]